VTNHEVADLLRLIGDMLEIKGEVIYKSLAYRRAADNIEWLERDISDVWRDGSLRDIPGVGAALEKKLDELLGTGRLGYFDKLQQDVPPTVVDLLNIADVGPKTARILWKELGATSIADVERAARAGRLRALRGLGERSEQRILEAIHSLSLRTARIPLGLAWPVAQELSRALRQAPGVARVEPVGSLRRMKDTVGDVALLAACAVLDDALEALVDLPQVGEVASQSPTQATVTLLTGLQVRLRAVQPEHYGSLLQRLTGSQEHNAALRALAQHQGLSRSELGFTRDGGSEIPCLQEEEVYRALGLACPPPELRENRGELLAAQDGALPNLVERRDILGDLHVHTSWSDAAATPQEMAEAARALGYAYLVISDHTHGLGVANGLDVERLRQQRTEIDALNERYSDFCLLHGAEVEIRGDGSLDFPDHVLGELDVVIASVHSGLRQDKETITARVVGAMRNPHVDVIGHPSGRLLGRREASQVDLDRVLQVAAETGTILEINARPKRLDLDDIRVRRAVDQGVDLCINSDAHSISGLGVMDYGVATARRGWAEARHIVNTWPLERLRRLLARKEQAARR